AVSPLLTQYLGAIQKPLVVDEQASTLSTREVLGLMKAQGGQRAQGTEWTPAILTKEPMGIVFQDCDGPVGDNAVDRVHLACHAGIVHCHNRSRPQGDQFRKEPLVEVQSVNTGIYEYRPSAPQNERVGGRCERIGRDDHLIPGRDVDEKRHHFQGACSRGGQQSGRYIQLLLEQLTYPAREGSVA